jgi:hypothetical protein
MADTVAVRRLLDNVAYYAITLDDTTIRCWKGQDDRYRVDGDLMLTSPEMLAQHIRNCLRLLDVLADAPKVVLLHLPCNLTASWCSEVGNALDRLEEGYCEKDTSGAERLGKSICDQLLESGVHNFR